MVTHHSGGSDSLRHRVEAAGVAAMRTTLDRHGPVPRAAPSDPMDQRAVMAWLERALRAERARGLRGDWAYDVNRHIALAQALGRLRAEHGIPKQKRRGR